jgi:hypothetical protein
LRTAQRSVIENSTYFSNPAIGQGFLSRLAAQNAPSIDDLITGGAIVCGNPRSVIEQIRRLHAELGNGIFNFMLKVGNLPDEAVYRSMRLFKSDVLPYVTDL